MNNMSAPNPMAERASYIEDLEKDVKDFYEVWQNAEKDLDEAFAWRSKTRKDYEEALKRLEEETQ